MIETVTLDPEQVARLRKEFTDVIERQTEALTNIRDLCIASAALTQADALRHIVSDAAMMAHDAIAKGGE